MVVPMTRLRLHSLFSQLVLIGVATIATSACGSSKPVVEKAEPAQAPQAAPVADVGIEFVIEPETASVIVDGEYLGAAGDLMGRGVLALEPGLHQIMIRDENYETYRVEVTLGETTQKIEVSLQAL